MEVFYIRKVMVRKIAKKWHYKDVETEHEELKKKCPKLNILRSATMISDGEVFEIGQWVEIDGINGDNTVRLIGFDEYDYPVPMEVRKNMPESELVRNFYKRIIRGAYDCVGYYAFTDLEGFEWLKVKKNVEEEPSQNIMVNNIETNIYQPHATYEYASDLEQ